MKYKYLITKFLDFSAGIYDPLLRLTIDEQEFRKELVDKIEALSKKGKLYNAIDGYRGYLNFIVNYV